jgi:hypothetical protein
MEIVIEFAGPKETSLLVVLSHRRSLFHCHGVKELLSRWGRSEEIVLFIFLQIVSLAGGGPGSHAEGSFGNLVGIDDNVSGIRCLRFHALEVCGGDLEAVEGDSSGPEIDFLLKDHLGDLANDELDGVRVLENGQRDVAGMTGGKPIFVALDILGTGLAVVVAELLSAESGRAALGSAGFDVLTTWCKE